MGAEVMEFVVAFVAVLVELVGVFKVSPALSLVIVLGWRFIKRKLKMKDKVAFIFECIGLGVYIGVFYLHILLMRIDSLVVSAIIAVADIIVLVAVVGAMLSSGDSLEDVHLMRKRRTRNEGQGRTCI